MNKKLIIFLIVLMIGLIGNLKYASNNEVLGDSLDETIVEGNGEDENNNNNNLDNNGLNNEPENGINGILPPPDGDGDNSGNNKPVSFSMNNNIKKTYM